MKHGIKIFVAILSASAMLFAGCGKAEVSDDTEVNSLKKNIISTIDRHIDKIDGQIASFGEELASMKDSDKYQAEDIRVLEEKLSALSKELSYRKSRACGYKRPGFSVS